MSEDEPRSLERFVAAQESVWPRVVAELRDGRKRTHWMWFVFPQIAGLGRSETARRYALDGLGEARAYLAHPLLGARLEEATGLMLASGGDDAHAVLGSPDDLKFRSSMTLFERAWPAPGDAPGDAHGDVAVADGPAGGAASGVQNVFRLALERFHGGVPDPRTIALLDARDG